ncbi:MAG: hypothetical protein KKA68_21080 [Gammaproteobacteria bacterium]|nr:hypothetical protein [Gammaproteobacteria bacterium]
MKAEQVGDDVELTLFGQTRVLKNCSAIKLVRTIYGKPGDVYTEEEMMQWDLKKKQ